MLLDTASLYFRAFFGVPDTKRAPDGTPVHAVRGMLDFVTRLVADHSPDAVVACWDDDWRPAFRVDLVPTYKAHRVAGAAAGAAESAGEPAGAVVEEVPDLLSVQVPFIRAALPAIGVPVIGSPGFEADDVIGTLTSRTTDEVDVVTGDRDLFQLVEDRVRVLYTARGVRRLESVDDAWLLAKYGVTGQQYTDFATLRGDASDGLPGVKGIGEKTAAALLSEHGDLASILAAAADEDTTMRPAVRSALLASGTYIEAAVQVVAVRRDLPIDVPASRPDPVAAQRIAEQLGIERTMGRAAAAVAQLG